MTSGRRIAGAALALTIAAAPAYAQSLGEVARQEEARRAATAKAVKSLSNANLGPDGVTTASASAPVESCYTSTIQKRCLSAEEMLAENKWGFATKENSAQNWRSDAASLRARLENAQVAVASLEAAAADEARSVGARSSAEKALITARLEVSFLERRWETFEKAAVNQHVPRAWIEPIPALTTRNPQQSGKPQ